MPRAGANGNAALALWLGIAGLLLCGLPSPFAIALAVRARREIAANPGRFSNARQAKVGLVLGALGASVYLAAGAALLAGVGK